MSTETQLYFKRKATLKILFLLWHYTELSASWRFETLPFKQLPFALEHYNLDKDLGLATTQKAITDPSIEYFVELWVQLENISNSDTRGTITADQEKSYVFICDRFGFTKGCRIKPDERLKVCEWVRGAFVLANSRDWLNTDLDQ